MKRLQFGAQAAQNYSKANGVNDRLQIKQHGSNVEPDFGDVDRVQVQCGGDVGIEDGPINQRAQREEGQHQKGARHLFPLTALLLGGL